MTAPTLHEAQRAVLASALDVLRHEQALATDTPNVAALQKAEDALKLRCRDYVNLIDGLPPTDWPKDWQVTG